MALWPNDSWTYAGDPFKAIGLAATLGIILVFRSNHTGEHTYQTTVFQPLLHGFSMRPRIDPFPCRRK